MPVSTLTPKCDAAAIALNVRRVMARDGLTFDDVVEATDLDERTVRGLVRGTNNPHARTLHKLVRGLGISIDELFQPCVVPPERAFDETTNALIHDVVAAHAEVFDGWSDSEFGELYSRFGTGGGLNASGVLAAAEAMNAKRSLLKQVCVILESSEADVLVDVVGVLYRRATAS